MIMWEQTVDGMTARCEYLSSTREFKVVVTQGSIKKEELFRSNFEPLFGMDVVDAHQSNVIAEKLAVEIEKELGINQNFGHSFYLMGKKKDFLKLKTALEKEGFKVSGGKTGGQTPSSLVLVSKKEAQQEEISLEKLTGEYQGYWGVFVIALDDRNMGTINQVIDNLGMILESKGQSGGFDATDFYLLKNK